MGGWIVYETIYLNSLYFVNLLKYIYFGVPLLKDGSFVYPIVIEANRV